ncbi:MULTISPECIES: DHA2 family efflux MFS transporter permease subunit [Streptomyces]|uniref:DHA2 family efflux MFS transporter permease subunit n=1 Tax=Streptomyces TaxID=1883 RepID=UPI00093F048F|nr:MULTISPECIES: DHA2 family efflux MFS transporter permease subunit [unclassified Streptomyces]OKJ15228.1 MFS transporter [Streptomyces sp. TSRI0261]QNQ34553.1 DHA2 family efflux MFS transporter permease subunit [Streptomyces sp. CB00271]
MDAQHGTTGRGGAVWVLVITSVAGFMAALDNLVVTTALPSIRQSLGGGLEDLEWTVNAYTLTFAVLLMLGAALGDRFGRRRLFMVGLAVFTAASAAAALSPGIGELIAFRAAQGVGAAIMMPLTLTLIGAAVPPERRGAALGVFGAVTGTAVAGGPLIGGALTEHISWQWIFWLNVPTGLALLALARLRLGESYAPKAPLDIRGTVLVSAGLFGIVYALVDTASHGWTDPVVLTGLTAGTALLALFVRHGIRAENPMLPMRLFRSRAFLGINAASLLMFLGMFGSIFLLSQFLQTGLGHSPTEAGLRMLPWTGMPILVAPFAGYLSDRFGGRPVVVTGLALQAVGLALFALIIEPGVSYTALVIGGVGMALYFAPAASLVLSSVRPGEQGIASGANNALREVGGALGVAVLAAVFAAQGGYGSPRLFADGTVPAVWIGAGAVALGALVALLIPGRRSAGRPAPEPVDRRATEPEPVAARAAPLGSGES